MLRSFGAGGGGGGEGLGFRRGGFEAKGLRAQRLRFEIRFWEGLCRFHGSSLFCDLLLSVGTK